MKLRCGPTLTESAGSVLVLVMVFLTVSLVVLTAALSWTQTSTQLTGRHNQYFRTAAAAEAATEKVVARITRDYQSQGESLVFARLSDYRALVPSVDESPLWSNYRFSDAQGNHDHTYVELVAPTEFRMLSSQYRGLRGYASTPRIVSNARETPARFDNLVAAVRQDIEIATIPLFQFAIFYNTDLEINPGPTMTVSGPVHCNTNIFLQPQSTLTFQSDVTAVASIIPDKKPGDPLVRPKGPIVFQGEHDGGVSSLTLPIGTDSSPATARQVVELPPSDESPNSPMGKERYYNKADLIILVSDSGIAVKSGRVNNFATAIPSSQYSQFIDTSVTFFNKRENKTIKTTQINVGNLRQWNQTNTLLRPILPAQDVGTIYVDDMRSQSASTESGVRLVNGQTLLPKGLTVATPNPLYLQGNYNAPASSLGTANTADTLPASVVADAVTVLSTAWKDPNSGGALSSRNAANTTVNAAFLAGIVPTTTGSYSGGVENFPRFIEDWSGKTFTYNGSMVVMYESRYATGQWRGTGSSIGIYNPPNRNWAFDQNFRNPNRLPPGCPGVRALIRDKWAMIKPNSTS
jgi:hypothetical protein